MKPNLISIYPKEFYHPEVVKKLISEANVKFGPFDRDQFLKELSDVKGIILDGDIRLNEEVLQVAPRLVVVSMFGVGYDIVDVEACTQHNVYVTIT